MIEHKLIKVEEDSPFRCQSVTDKGQCSFKAYEVSEGTYKKYCIMHGGGKETKGIKEKQLRNYRFNKYQVRIGEFADNDQVKSLREEIGILRIVMEETVNKCHDSGDLLIYSSKITDLAIKIDKIVTSCHRLETSLGETLNKTKVLNIATRIVNIISLHIADENIINLIVEDIGVMVRES